MSTGKFDFRYLRLLPLQFYRHIVAERFLFHIVAVHGIGPGTAPSADVEIFALAAFPLVRLEITQVVKQLGVLPDFTERGLLDVAGGAVEIRAWLYIAKAVDQADGLRGDASLAAAGG